VRILRLVALIGIGMSAAQSYAATLQGTVLNKNTKRYLERATVQVLGTQLSAMTDKEGRFRIAGLAPGTHQISVTYAGLGELITPVTVGEEVSPRVVLELTSSDVYTMAEEVVVTSPLEGNAYAINQQRKAESVRSVVSVDAFIDQSTGSPGEFLKSVHGIQMDYVQNEPQTPRVRGFDATLTKVTMDGNEIASAASSSTDRTVQIDQLSIASIGAVEVYKAPIPSMSANAVGGSINFTSKSATQSIGRRASIQLGTAVDGHSYFGTYRGPGHGEKSTQRGVYPTGRAEFSNSFFGNRLGLFASAGHEKSNQLGSSVTHDINVSAGPPLPADFTLENATVRRGSMSFAPNRQLRARDDVSVNADLKASEQVALYLRTSLSGYHSTNRNHGFTLNPGTAYAPGSTVDTYTVTNGTASQGTSIFDKYTKTWQINPGANVFAGPWRFDVAGGFSKSINHYDNLDNFTSLTTTLPGVGWTMTTPRNTDTPSSIVQNGGPSFYDLNSYRSNQGDLVATGGQHRADHNGLVSNNVRHSWDVRQSARLDVQRDLETGFPLYLKAGLAVNQTKRERNNPQTRYYWMGLDGRATADDRTAAGLQLGRFAENPPVGQGIEGWTLREPDYFCSTCLFDYWQANPQVLQENLAYTRQQEFVGYRFVDEKIYAAYLMGNMTKGKLNALAGVRLERTDTVAIGHAVAPMPTDLVARGVSPNSLEAIERTYSRKQTDAVYTSRIFPYLHLRYEFLPSVQARAAYTEAIGRPNFTDILPSFTEDSASQTISSNRVGLLPQRSQNVDLSVEYYTKSAGAWTIGWYRRDIDKYISAATVPMNQDLLDEFNLGSEYLTWRLSTKENLGFAKWSGYEIEVRQQLRDWGVPQFLGGLELFANFTHTYQTSGTFGTVTATNAQGQRIETLSGVVPKLINASISYRSPKGRLFVSLLTNYQSARPTQNLPAVNSTAQRRPQQEPYQFWNSELSYAVTPKLRVQAIGRNLTQTRPTFSEIGIIRNTQQDTGRQFLLAFKLDL
jgi:iron complex outermembrane recepter protein